MVDFIEVPTLDRTDAIRHSTGALFEVNFK